jgi:hypothetical protein
MNPTTTNLTLGDPRIIGDRSFNSMHIETGQRLTNLYARLTGFDLLCDDF